MPRQTRLIDEHPQKDQIIAALVANESSRSIAKWTKPPVSHHAVSRYKCLVVSPAVDCAKSARYIADSKLARQPNDVLPSRTKAALKEQTKQVLEVATDPRVQEYVTELDRHRDVIDRQVAVADEAGDTRGLAAILTSDTNRIRTRAQIEGTGAMDPARAAAAGASTTQVLVVMPSLPAPESAEVVDVEVVDS